jgi:hypothetical protein
MENRLDKFKETSRLTTITKQLRNNIKTTRKQYKTIKKTI